MKRKVTIAALAAVAAAVAHPQERALRTPDEVLAAAREKLDLMTRRLPKYACVETVERSYFRRANPALPRPDCDRIAGDKKRGRYKLKLDFMDRVRLDVAAAEGQEIYSWAGASRFDSNDIGRIVGEGPTGTGAFGTYLIEVFDNEGAHFQYLGERPLDGRSFFEYRFQVPRDASHYRVRTREGWYITAFDGSFQIDPESAELRRLTIRTDELPPETTMCEAASILDYRRVRIGEGDFLLPLESQLQIVQRDTGETISVTTFSACREYHAESTIRFGAGVEEAGFAAHPDGRAPAALPAGLTVPLALAAAIDTATAAAGDTVLAMVAHPVREPKTKATLIPAGAMVHGRITRMRRKFGSAPGFVISISFDTLELNGVASPFCAILDRSEEWQIARLLNRGIPRRIELPPPPPGLTGIGGSLLFPTAASHHRVPAGYQSKWLTVEPAAKR